MSEITSTAGLSSIAPELLVLINAAIQGGWKVRLLRQPKPFVFPDLGRIVDISSAGPCGGVSLHCEEYLYTIHLDAAELEDFSLVWDIQT